MIRHDDIEQKSSLWHQFRKGKMMGSMLKSIMGTPKAREEAKYDMIAARLTVGVASDDDYENAMARGNRLEPDAIAMFELEYDKVVERTGAVQDDMNPLMANSPDGLIGETEAVEAKCMGGKNHVKTWLTNKIPEESGTHNYKWQCIQYFVVNEKLETLYFVSYNPDIPVHPLHVITLTREQAMKDIDKARVEQEKFLGEVETILSTIIKDL